MSESRAAAPLEDVRQRLSDPGASLPVLMVLSSTYPRWANDHEPRFVHELCKRLAGEFRVIVVCPHAPGAQRNEWMDGVEIVRYRYAPAPLQTLVNDGGIVTNLKNSPWKFLLLPGFLAMQFATALRLCRKERVRVIHAHWLIPQGLIALLIQTFSRARPGFLVTSHGADLYALQGVVPSALKRWVVRKSSAVTVVSSAMKGKVEALGAEAVTVLPMGVDLNELFRPDPAVRRSSTEIVFVGRLVEKKGVRYLIEALPAVLSAVPDARLTIAGFGPEEAMLREVVQRLGLETCVRFLGAVPPTELPPLYRRAALFVSPFVRAASGDQEGLPVALMEAVACGCPVVVGEVSGLEDLLGELQREVCVNAHDVPALAEKIIEALQSPDVSRCRAEAIKQRALHHVDWGRIAEDYARLLAAAASTSRD